MYYEDCKILYNIVLLHTQCQSEVLLLDVKLSPVIHIHIAHKFKVQNVLMPVSYDIY